MTIRNILLAFTLLLSLALFSSLATNIWETKQRYEEAQQLVDLDEVRAHLLVADRLFAEEMSRTYFLIKRHVSTAALADELNTLRKSVDLRFSAATYRLFAAARKQNAGEDQLETLASIVSDIHAARMQLTEEGPGETRMRPDPTGRTWLRQALGISINLHRFRLSLLQQSRTLNPIAGALARLRQYSSLLGEFLQYDRALVGGAIIDGGFYADQIEEVTLDKGRIDIVWKLARGQVSVVDDPNIVEKLHFAQQAYEHSYLPLQSVTLQRVGRIAEPTRRADGWMLTTRRTIDRIDDLQAELLSASRAILLEAQSDSANKLLIWIAVGAAGLLLAVGSSIAVRDLVTRPIDRIKDIMLRLAANDLSVAVPRANRQDEIASMIAALRKFKANSIRRDRLHNELDALHSELAATHAQLRADLDAAAAIQRSLQPIPGACGSLSYCSLYRAASVLGGDSQDVICRPDNQIVFFQIDVAGHGTAAALCSVTIHHALSDLVKTQSLLDSPERMIADLNRSWPEELPYFTVCLGQIDTASGYGVLVQAGHPAPLRIDREGRVTPIGHGGIPVGMVAEPDHEPVRFHLGKGEKILLYTDGLVEATDPHGNMFEEFRLRQIVDDYYGRPADKLLAGIDTALGEWRQSDSFYDDLAVLLIENREGV